MAKFNADFSYDLIKEFEDLGANCTEMFSEMVDAGAETVLKNVRNEMKKSFKSTATLEKGLKKTRIYKTPTDDGINVKVAFYGYDSSKVTKKYPQGVPIPLIAMAREYGTSRGEKDEPFFRKSFKKTEIEVAMKQVQDKYIKED